LRHRAAILWHCIKIFIAIINALIHELYLTSKRTMTTKVIIIIIIDFHWIVFQPQHTLESLAGGGALCHAPSNGQNATWTIRTIRFTNINCSYITLNHIL